MKYVALIIAGMIFGAFSDKAWGIWVGIFLGFLIAWVSNLQNKINLLEKQLKQYKKPLPSDQPTEQSQSTTSTTTVSPPKPSDPDQQQDIDSIPVVALSSEQDIKHHLEIAEIPEPQAESEEDSLVSKQSDDLSEQNYSDYEAEDISFVESATTTTELKDSKPAISTEQKPIDKAIQKIKSLVVSYFTGGNSLVRTGMLVLFVGVAFLLKYVAERTVVPVEYRYIGIALGCLVMLFLGWKLRHKRPNYALSLQGGAIGLLYLTLFAAMRLHQLLPPSVVLISLVTIVILSAIMAILQNSMALAVIGLIGGFAAPILTSTGSGSHVHLFAYYLFLNLGILGIAWFKSWRLLNILGFIATFAVGSIWGYKFYQPHNFATVEPFLVAHFLLYVLIAVLFAFKQPPKLKGINDGTLIFGTPIVVLSLQAGLVKDMTYGLAYSALVMGLFYLFLSFIINQLHRPYFKNLIESFIALGVGFLTLAVPLAFDGHVTSAMWVAEASALVWVGIRQQRLLPRFSGYALTVFGSFAFFVEPAGIQKVMPFMNANFIGVFIIVAATAFMGLYARKNTNLLKSIEIPWVSRLMIINAIVWWILGGMVELDKHFSNQWYLLSQIWIMATSLFLLYWGQKWSYRILLRSGLLAAVLMFPLLLDVPMVHPDWLMFWNIRFISLLLVTLFYFYMSTRCRQSDWFASTQQKMSWSRYFLAVGLLIWILAISAEIHVFIPIEQLVWKTLLMSLTAGVLLWVGHKKSISDYQWAAVIVTFAMVIPIFMTLVLHEWPLPNTGLENSPVLNVASLALLLYFTNHFLMGYYWQKYMLDSSRLSLMVSRLLLLLSLASWLINGLMELNEFFVPPLWITVFLIFISLSMMALTWAAHRLKWQDLHLIKYAMTPFIAYMVVMVAMIQDFHEAYGLVVWALAFMVNYLILKKYDNTDMKFLNAYHAISLWSLTFIAVHEFAELIGHLTVNNNIWFSTSFAIMLWLVIALIYGLRNILNWPLVKYAKAYFQLAVPVMFWLLWLMVILLNINSPGISIGIPYLPLFNVIDIIGILSIWLAIKLHQNDEAGLFLKDIKIKYVILALTGFLMLNATMLRCFHYWYGIDYQLNDLMSSFMIQTGFSILWAITAVTLMVLAAKKQMRLVWLLGLGLMIVVVVKLFLVDMSASGSIERIVAFLTVGFLLSLVGYFSPLPPDNKE